MKLYNLRAWPLGYKTFLCSTEHVIYHAHKCSKIVGILTFISMINTPSEKLKARKIFFSAIKFFMNS